MRRRRFIKDVFICSVGATLIPTFFSCNTKQRKSLNTLIGKNIKEFKQFSILGNEEFSYINLEGDKFSTDFKANSAVLYFENQKMVGYTLALSENVFKKLKEKYGKPERSIKNYFGEKWVWKKDTIKRSLTIVKSNSLFLYSYYLQKNKLIVF